MGLCIPQGIKSKLPGEDSELLQTTFPFPPAFFLPLFICPLLTYPSLTCCQGQGQLGALPLCFLSPGSPLSLQGGGCCSYTSLQDLAQAHFIPDVSVSTPPRNLNAVLCVTSFFCFKKKLCYIGVQQINNLMVISGGQQRDSATHKHVSITFFFRTQGRKQIHHNINSCVQGVSAICQSCLGTRTVFPPTL